MTKEYEVLPYSIKLKEVFPAYCKTDVTSTSDKSHLEYFETYLKYLNTKTIIVEKDYVDRDYLEDYAAYYVRSFTNYDRKCTRLHFFDKAFTENEFTKLLIRDPDSTFSTDDLQKSYLGFLIIKPLPLTFIGRTCIKTYPSENRRYFPVIRKYKANLFGFNLYVDSIAYQEQDSVLAACATSALWSVFQGTGSLFQHAIPSPVEITKAATKNLPFADRHFPNKGLSTEQMAHAIRSVGLEPYVIGAEDTDLGDYYILRSTLYAYLRGNIPLILGINLFGLSASVPKFIGNHAIAITGYGLNANLSQNTNQLLLKSSKIDKIYVHDDQIGPFAKMVFDNKFIPFRDKNGKEINRPSLSTSWKHTSGNNVRAIPQILLVPVYHKIRIPFHKILDVVSYFYQFIRPLDKLLNLSIFADLEWDIFITTITDFKTEILEHSSLDGNYRKQILTEQMPRFIWRAIANKESNPVIELLFDATDIEQGSFFLRPIEYNDIFPSILREFVKVVDCSTIVKDINLQKILTWFNKNT